MLRLVKKEASTNDRYWHFSDVAQSATQVRDTPINGHHCIAETLTNIVRRMVASRGIICRPSIDGAHRALAP